MGLGISGSKGPNEANIPYIHSCYQANDILFRGDLVALGQTNHYQTKIGQCTENGVHKNNRWQRATPVYCRAKEVYRAICAKFVIFRFILILMFSAVHATVTEI